MFKLKLIETGIKVKGLHILKIRILKTGDNISNLNEYSRRYAIINGWKWKVTKDAIVNQKTGACLVVE